MIFIADLCYSLWLFYGKSNTNSSNITKPIYLRMSKSLIPQSQQSNRENLNWLFYVRIFLISGGSSINIIVIYGLGLKLPETALWIIVVAICAYNYYTLKRLDQDEPVADLEVFFHLSMDVVAISLMLFLTGGATNPLIWIFLLPLIITGIMLPDIYTWYMVFMTTTLYTFLIGYHIPLPTIGPQSLDTNTLNKFAIPYENPFFDVQIFGIWFGFALSAGLVAFFVVELASNLRERERKLAEARETALRDERVIALGTLAASAAHDMGTPLGTMAIVTHEINQDYQQQHFPELYEKVQIIQEQIDRCKQALSVMSATGGEMRAESGQIMQLNDYFDEVLNQWRIHQAATKLNLEIEPASANLQIIADRTLTHSIINIMNNAAEATQQALGIDFHAICTDQGFILKIRDYGPGIDADILAIAGKQPVVSKKSGLGVGLFLTFASINRLGGSFKIYNLVEGGACSEIEIPFLPPKIRIPKFLT